jgi:hypothetical protein
MNCLRIGSWYGLFQSMSDSRYGETRTLIGARAKPMVASSMNSADTTSRRASRSLSGRVMDFFACHL